MVEILQDEPNATTATGEPLWPSFPPGCHPLDQAALWSKLPAYPWQINALRAFAQPFSRVALAVVNEGGKTAFLGPIAILSVMAAFPGARCFCMSKSVSQTKDQMFEPMRQIVDEWPNTWSYTSSSQDMKITHANGSVCKFYAPSDPDNVEGYHNAWRNVGGKWRFCPCVYWTDEDKGRSDEVFFRIIRINPFFWLSTSSTGQAQGFFFDAISPETLKPISADKELSEPLLLRAAYPDILKPDGMPNYNPEAAWTYRDMVSRDRCPHLMTDDAKARLKAEEEKYGRNHPTVRAKRDCVFTISEGQNLIFEQRHIEAMLRAMRGENTPLPGDVRFAADVGGDAGGDESPMMARMGSEIVLIRDKWKAINEVDRAEEWVLMLRTLGIQPHQFSIDAGGIGNTVAKIMEMTHGYYGVVRRVSGEDAYDKDAYYDRYTEIHYELRALLEMNVLKLPYCSKLLRDMRERLFVDKEDRVKTQPKQNGESHRKRYGHSPNHLDTLIYLLWDFPFDSVRAMAEEKAKASVKAGVREWDRQTERRTMDDQAFGGLLVLDPLNVAG